MTDLPPKPAARPDKVSLWRYLRLFRRDILSAQPAKLYGAWMAEFRTPFFRSYLINDPKLIETVLKTDPDDFPKSDRISAGLQPLLGESVFLTNGAVWKRQRRIIDPAFEGGRLRDTFPGIFAAGQAGAARLIADDTPQEIEAIASHIAADVIFRTLFSLPIEDETAQKVFLEFRSYQRSQPILNLAAFIPGPRWMPRFFRPATRLAAKNIRALITQLTTARLDMIAKGTAPNDLATKIMTTQDPETGELFSVSEMVDQVAIFFLAGHETSASALAWSLYLLAGAPDWQDKVAAEAAQFDGNFANLSQLKVTRDVFREALRLYPPVPMMVREAQAPTLFRKRAIKRGAQIVLSPWHLHRHNRLWDNPDGFDPNRWQSENGKTCARTAFMPFSAGPRVCPGAGFAMIEGVTLLATLLKNHEFHLSQDRIPIPVAHLTVRAEDGIWLRIMPRRSADI
ncbi:cytochrome P450 [Loktanella sp. D2R18]|uniref:cytochrome P450 n=1 Tax=Rhodobacterales TaxID=204455 RepID=UPI000DE84741|nr:MULTISPECIES: cytochrome P450 [Rhodobacterales]MDO6590749.1 cytochrome P450 [Yoonia sp. 1_MG-2023]RBW44633.1 cytochrome P450 [Loktanella sp. D2R18]